jgi:hypothetical protein
MSLYLKKVGNQILAHVLQEAAMRATCRSERCARI